MKVYRSSFVFQYPRGNTKPNNDTLTTPLAVYSQTKINIKGTSNRFFGDIFSVEKCGYKYGYVWGRVKIIPYWLCNQLQGEVSEAQKMDEWFNRQIDNGGERHKDWWYTSKNSLIWGGTIKMLWMIGHSDEFTKSYGSSRWFSTKTARVVAVTIRSFPE